MAVSIYVQTWVTFNKIPENAPAGSLALLNAATGLNLSPGDDNPFWKDLQDLDLGGGQLKYRGRTMEDLAEFTEIENTSFLMINQVKLFALVGEVENYPVFLEIPDATAEVPATFPNREIVTLDENEQEVVTIHTFNSYYENTPYPQDIDGTLYAPAQAFAGGRNGKTMKASEWVPTGLNAITVAEFQALQPSTPEA